MFLRAKQCLSISEKILLLLLVNNLIRIPFMSWIGEVVTVLGIALITLQFFLLAKKIEVVILTLLKVIRTAK